jgi:hypothetical protein
MIESPLFPEMHRRLSLPLAVRLRRRRSFDNAPPTSHQHRQHAKPYAMRAARAPNNPIADWCSEIDATVSIPLTGNPGLDSKHTYRCSVNFPCVLVTVKHVEFLSEVRKGGGSVALDQHWDSIGMTASAKLVRRLGQNSSRVTQGKQYFVDLGDGRSAWARRWNDLVLMHASDLGGYETLSEAQISICKRVATLECELEAMEGRISASLQREFSLRARHREAC